MSNIIRHNAGRYGPGFRPGGQRKEGAAGSYSTVATVPTIELRPDAEAKYRSIKVYALVEITENS
jgi:hypothetical protein